MNLREFSNANRLKIIDNNRNSLIAVNALALLVILFIPGSIYLFFNSLPVAGLVAGAMLVLWVMFTSDSQVGYGWLWSAVAHSVSPHVEYAICHKCYKSIELNTKPGEEWICNYCSEGFQGNVLDSCPKCGELQRTFPCTHCDTNFDIDANYDEEGRKTGRYSEQTRLIGR